MTRRVKGDEGATAVEFALVLPVLLSFVFGIMAFGLHLTYAAVAEHSVREGLREATARTNKYDSSSYGGLTRVTDRVNSTVPGFLPVATTVSCDVVRVQASTTCADESGVHQGEQVTVTATYSVPGVTDAVKAIPFIGDGLSGLSRVTRSATGRRE